MKSIRKSIALILALSIAFTLIPAQASAQNTKGADSEPGDMLIPNVFSAFQAPASYESSPALDAIPEADTQINSPSGITYDSRVSYKIVTAGRAAETDVETRSAVIRFTLKNPSEQQVTFEYNAVHGSAEDRHLTGTTWGTVSLSQAVPERDVTIQIAPFADNPGDYNLPNPPNTFWSGEHFFYLYCGNIQNALFEEERDSLTVPVPVESEFDYKEAYENAINTTLIDLNSADGGTNGVYPLSEGLELKLTADISGDIRKMIDDHVFTHIYPIQGYFINKSVEVHDITYEIKARNHITGSEAYMFKSQFTSLSPNSQASFYAEELPPRAILLEEVNLGPSCEDNGLFNELNFTFAAATDAVSVCFLDLNGQYLQHQVSFSDQAYPEVIGASIGVSQAHYGDEIPVIIEFSEPVYTDNITFDMGGQTLRPMEGTGTISTTVSFLHRIGDEALNAGSFTYHINDIIGTVDLSGKAREYSEISASVDIAFDPRLTFAYCAEPFVTLDQGKNRNMAVTVSIPLKQDTALSNWLISEDNISTAVKARAITKEGPEDILLTVQTDMMQVTGLTGSFTAPENNTGEDVFYALEIYLDTGSGHELVPSLTTLYAVEPLILIEGENDITIDYTSWPPSDSVFINTGKSLSLEYHLNVDATWIESEYFCWSSSDESIAIIDEAGNILLKGVGQVYFTLTVTNPLSDTAIQFDSRTLTVLESQEAFLYVPNGIKNQDLLIGSNAKIAFSSNLVDRNNLYNGSGTETAYTFTLYEANYDEGGLIKGSPLSTEVLFATVQAPLNSYTVPAESLTKVTANNRYGYILEISAEDINSGITMTAEANIRIRQIPAKASLIRPESVFLTDGDDSFTVGFDILNKTSETEYSLTVTRNSESAPVKTAASPASIQPLSINISDVERSRLLDVYTVSLKAKNLSDEAWSYDSYCVYVYNSSAMNMLLDGFPAPGELTMDYDFEDAEIIYGINFLKYRSMIGRELIRTVTIDDISYTWSAIADRVTWTVEGDSVSLWYGFGSNTRRIGDDYSPVLLPGTSLVLRGDAAGSSVVIATHTLTGITDSMNVTLKPLNDKLYLFRVYPNVSCELVYTNGNNEKKTVAFTGEIGVYEESGIAGDVEIYPTSGAENVYDFCTIKHNALMANQKVTGSFELYPINTIKLTNINYSVTLELFDEETGRPYTDDIIIRGGVYHNGSYRSQTTINGKMGNADQTVSANEKGRYSLVFRPSDFTDSLLASDKLSYVIELGFADNSHRTQYITVENDDIQAQKVSPLGVCRKEGIRALSASSLQNNATILSQTLTIDDEERFISDRICLDGAPNSATLDMIVSVPQHSYNLYRLSMYDSSGLSLAESKFGELIYAYPFSDTVTLHIVCDITKMLKYGSPGNKPGEVCFYNPCISSADWSQVIKLSEQLEVQNLQSIPKMDSLFKMVGGEPGDLAAFYSDLWFLTKDSGNISFSEENDVVKPSLDFLKNYRLDNSSIGLEVQSTDDPLLYKGIIRFAVGSYSKDNPSGVFVGSGEKVSFSFMPGPSDMKAMSKGTFLQKAKNEMNDKGGIYKTYGGGAYIDCEVYYDIDEYEWKLRLLYGDFYLGGGGGFRKNFNGWVSFIPVTATFSYSMTAEVGLTVLHSRAKNTTAYIPRLRPVFSVYGFGGVGFDYNFFAFKAGGYGFLEHEQLYRWYTDDKGLKMDGQQLKVSGEVGVEFAIRLAFIKLSGKYELADYSKSWEYNEHNEISKKIAENATERSIKRFLAPGQFSGSDDLDMMMLVPVEESAAFEDRSYLKSYERCWGFSSSARRSFALFSEEESTDIWSNAYPNAAPQLSDDGQLMVYISDMGSEELSDTSVLFAIKDEAGFFSTEGEQIDASDYPDSSPSLSGTTEGASAVWIRTFSDMVGKAGSQATMEDIVNGLAASEVMAGIYKDGAFTSTRLTDNAHPELSPVTAASGKRAIVAWRSVSLGDMDNPLDFTCDYIMYSVYNGSSWSEAMCLYDGSVDKVCALNTAMLPDGTSCVVYQIADTDGDSEIICAVLDANGAIVHTLRLTDNMTEDVNPQITTAKFPDGVNRFVIGWNAQNERGEDALHMVAVNLDGTLYTDFSLEQFDSTGATGYSNFRFTKGIEKLGDLSVIWSEPSDTDKDGIYEYSIFGAKLLISADNILSASGKQKLLGLIEGRTLDSLDSNVEPDTDKIHFVMLLSESSGASTLTTAVAEYKNLLTLEEPYYEYEDVLPGMDMPIVFTLRNDGIEPITHITIELGNQTFEYEHENILSGEYKTYLVSYLIPETLANTDFTVTAQFGASGDTGVQTGLLKLGLPDAGIYQIDITKETRRERGFRILLQNSAFADLKRGIHTVKLEVWDRPDFETGSPLKTFTISNDEIDALNNSPVSLEIALTEEYLQRFLDESGEIPKGGATIFFRTVLSEDGKTIEDADISNDIDYVNIYSLIEKTGTAVSLASLSETIGGITTVQVEAINNSMRAINNGNIIVTLRDEDGNILETQQTYASADSDSLLAIQGEESVMASVPFNRIGHTADVTFARVSGDSTLLSVLNLTGAPMKFNPNVFEYNIETYDLVQTKLTAVAENPSSIISVTKDDVPVLSSTPISISYGTTVFVITVTNGQTNTIYTVTVDNKRLDEDPGEDPENDSTKQSDSDTSHSYYAGLTIGTKQRNISISLSSGRAAISLGSLAQEIFSGDTEADLDIPTVSGVESYTLEVPAHTLAGSYTGAALTVSTELGSLRIPAGMLTGTPGIEGKIAGITIALADKSKLSEDIRMAIGARPSISLTLTLDGKQVDWRNSDGPVTVSIPYTPATWEAENLEGIVIWYIDGSGYGVSVPNGRYEPVTGTVTFSTTHFSDYAVVHNVVNFSDVTADAWYSKPVSFIAAREITSGTGDGKYSPDSILTRGEFIVLLMRAYSISPDDNPTDNFSDAGSKYYTGYLASAKRLGISVGMGNNMFAPDKAITRQEMFTLIYNALIAIKQLPEANKFNEDGQSKSLASFTDEGQIASWAREAMTLLVEASIINGNDGKFTPEGMTTRAQMAQVLYNLMTR